MNSADLLERFLAEEILNDKEARIYAIAFFSFPLLSLSATYEYVGREFGLSGARIQQIITKAETKMIRYGNHQDYVRFKAFLELLPEGNKKAHMVSWLERFYRRLDSRSKNSQ